MDDHFHLLRLEEALRDLTRPCAMPAGGMDFYSARTGRSIDENISDICEIGALHGTTIYVGGPRRRRTTLAREGKVS